MAPEGALWDHGAMADENLSADQGAIEAPVGSHVIVGIDGSVRDEPVLTTAAGEAARLGHALHIVHITPFMVAAMGTIPVAPIDDSGYSLDLLTRATEHVASLGLGIEVVTKSIAGRPENVLFDLSEDAALLVVGTGKKSAAGMFLFGTVSLSSVAHSACPVLVVGNPGPATPLGRVVVGVDGSDHSRAAVRLAAAQATARDAELVVHSSWYLEVIEGVVVTEPDSPRWAQVEGDYRAMQDRVIAAALGDEPGVRLRQVIVQGGAIDTLVKASSDADLVVVGNRGRGGFRSKLLGSVTMGLLRQSHCPVLVTRQT